MKEISKTELEEKSSYLLFIYTPFCGTCHVARAFLQQIESTLKKDIFYELNASFHSDFMQTYKVESVPCLFIKKDGEVVEKVYAFHSIQNIYHYLLEHARYLFEEEH